MKFSFGAPGSSTVGRIALAALGLGLVGASLSACAQKPAGESTQHGFVGEARYEALYRKTIANFPEKLPEGVTFPAKPPVLGGSIGVGNAAGAAYFFWNCSWEDRYLNSPSPRVQAEAMTQMRRFEETSWGAKYYDDPDGVWPKILKQAELGDPSELNSFYQSDCKFYRNSGEALAPTTSPFSTPTPSNS